MNVLTRLRTWLRSVLLRRRLDREMREEMEAHLKRAAERLMARGLSPEAARRAARREFGNEGYIQEMGREAWGSRWVDSLAGDLRFGLRHFARTPLATATIVLLLTLGIGANVGLFTVVHSLLTRPAPGIPRDDALVRIRGLQRITSFWGPRGMSHPEVLGYAEHGDIFGAVVAWERSRVVLDPTGEGEDALPGWATYVSDGYFDVLGVRPVLGGLPPPGEGGAHPAAVIGHSLWLERFGGARDALGRTLALNDVAITVVGVAPPRFSGVDPLPGPHVWLPLEARATVEGGGPVALASPDSTVLYAAARLRQGVTPERATPVVRAVAARWTEARTEPPRGEVDADVVPLRANNRQPGDRYVTEMAGGGALVLLLLLITCTNVSALLIGLSARRRHEIAVRLSLGASRARLVRQLVTESVMLTALGGALALGVVWLLVTVFGARVPGVEIDLAWPALVFTFAVATATGILFGLSPAFHATRLAVGDVLKDAAASVAASRSWLHRGLVVTQIALAQPLLVGGGVFVLFVAREALGRPDTTLHDRILSVSPERWGGEGWRAEVERFRERLLAVPEVEGAVTNSRGYSVFEVAVHPQDRRPGASMESFKGRTTFAAPGYFELMGIPFVRGRDFLPGEREGPERGGGASAVVIGSDLARDLWGEADPLGRRFVGAEEGATGPGETWGVVVGVVDERAAGASDEVSTLRVYVPRGFGRGLLVRTRGPAAAFIPTLRSLARDQWSDIPVSAETLAAEDAEERRVLVQVGSAAVGVGVLALLLSAIGLYAVIAFAVDQRTREIGVRRALGAERGRVVRLFFARGLGMGAAGLALGLPLSLAALHMIALRMGLLDVPMAPLTVATAVAVLAVASLATWWPAHRAAGVDPLVALRAE